jgi:hypothetical protein
MARKQNGPQIYSVAALVSAFCLLPIAFSLLLFVSRFTRTHALLVRYSPSLIV